MAIASTKKLLLVDFNPLLYRIVHSTWRQKKNETFDFTDLVCTVQGKEVNTTVLHPFCLTILAFLEEFDPTHMCFALDSRRSTLKRKEKYEKYKGGRKELTEMDQWVQDRLNFAHEEFPRFFKDAFGIKSIKVDQYEADDIIGTYTTRATNDWLDEDYTVIIQSCDLDFVQLLRPNVEIHTHNPSHPLAERRTHEEPGKRFSEKVGVELEQFLDFRALVGDPSDNIPGCKGIGPKRAQALLSKYRSLENIFEQIPEASKKRLKMWDNLEKQKEELLMYREIEEIEKDLELPEEDTLDSLELPVRSRETASSFLEVYKLQECMNKLQESKSRVFKS